MTPVYPPADDRFEIEQQTYRYAYTYDAGDVDGFAAVFTDDAVGDAVLVGQEQPFHSIQGTAEIRAFAEMGMSREGVRALHHPSGVVFDAFDGGAAETRATVVVTGTVPDTPDPVILTHGVYHDRWRKTEHGWRIAHRRYVAYGYRNR